MQAGSSFLCSCSVLYFPIAPSISSQNVRLPSSRTMAFFLYLLESSSLTVFCLLSRTKLLDDSSAADVFCITFWSLFCSTVSKCGPQFTSLQKISKTGHVQAAKFVNLVELDVDLSYRRLPFLSSCLTM